MRSRLVVSNGGFFPSTCCRRHSVDLHACLACPRHSSPFEAKEIGDVAAKHALAENRHATFQVASQFNCLEFVGPSVTPQHGITGYVRDRTQGPACSIACGPATAYRNFFAPVRGGPGGECEDETGQAKRQINNLEDLCVELDRKSAKRRKGKDEVLFRSFGSQFLEVRGGYTLASHRQLANLNAMLQSLSEGELDELRQSLRVGVHADVQVTSFAWGARPVKDATQLVTQIFGSACSVAYNRDARINSQLLWSWSSVALPISTAFKVWPRRARSRTGNPWRAWSWRPPTRQRSWQRFGRPGSTVGSVAHVGCCLAGHSLAWSCIFLTDPERSLQK